MKKLVTTIACYEGIDLETEVYADLEAHVVCIEVTSFADREAQWFGCHGQAFEAWDNGEDGNAIKRALWNAVTRATVASMRELKRDEDTPEPMRKASATAAAEEVRLGLKYVVRALVIGVPTN